MKSIVCIKQVPAVSELKFDEATKTLIREGVNNEINPFDRRALAYANELKKKYGGEVIVITMGPPQAKDALIEALATGADRALHLLDRAFAGSDTLATSRALSLVIEKERPFDLILCGKYSVDSETGHVGPEVAQFLGIPHVSGATSAEFSELSGRATCEVETEYGFQNVDTPLPFLMTTAERLIKPTRPNPEEIEGAKSKPYRIVTASELSNDLSIFGFKGSPTTVSEIYSAETRRLCEIIDGSTVDDKVSQLVQKLRAQGLFSGWEGDRVREIRPPDLRATAGTDAFWVVAESIQGQIRDVTYELMGRGIDLANQLGSELCAVILGKADDKQVQELISHGADKVYVTRDKALSTYSGDAYAAALAQAIARFNPYAVVAASTSFGRDFMPRVAAQLQLGMTGDCIGLEVNDQRQLVQLKPAFGGNIVAPILSKTRPQLATIRPGLLAPTSANPARKGNVIEIMTSNIEPRAKVVKERFESDRDAFRLDNAEIIVAAGAGIGRSENLEIINQLAEVLDAPIGTTRKVVDIGWLPRQLQIGLTGRSVAPKVYFAIGIRGAFNHMVGTGRARTVVAINKDPNALIFKNCDYGIVGDFAEVVPILTHQLSEAKRNLPETALGRT